MCFTTIKHFTADICNPLNAINQFLKLIWIVFNITLSRINETLIGLPNFQFYLLTKNFKMFSICGVFISAVSVLYLYVIYNSSGKPGWIPSDIDAITFFRYTNIKQAM